MSPRARPIAYLDGGRLSRGLQAGICRLVAHAEHLDRINVFPVPDGDTGTNLAVMLGAVRAALLRQRERHAGKLLAIVADAALDGARGNSGAILAQFLHGVCDASLGHRILAPGHLVAAVAQGSRYAHDALATPREGTLLTVMREFAEELAAQPQGHGQDFSSLLERGLARAQRALAATTAQLDVLRRAGVVDAGAQGFVYLLEGVVEFMRSGSLRGARSAAGADPGGPPQASGVSPGLAPGQDAPGAGPRWCTECLVVAENLDRRRLREAFAGLGSSLVIAGGTTRARIHIHADDPAAVFRTAARFGTVEARKADDMRLQQGALRAGGHTVAIVTDSAGDLPEELLTSLNIHVVPARIHFGARSYLDKVSLGTAEFYRLMAESPIHPTTSQPPPGDFRRLYQVLGSHHAGIVSIHLTGWGSGTFQAAVAAADRADTRAPVRAIDSRNASVGQGLVTLRAAELAAEGRNIDEISRALADVIPGTRTWALLGSLDHAVRGGRVAPSKRLLARLLRLEPILGTFPDGRIATAGMLAGQRDRVPRFGRWVARRIGKAEGLRLAVGHAGVPEAAATLAAALRAQIPGLEPAFITEIGTALGVHGGPGTLVVAVSPVDPGPPGKDPR